MADINNNEEQSTDIVDILNDLGQPVPEDINKDEPDTSAPEDNPATNNDPDEPSNNDPNPDTQSSSASPEDTLKQAKQNQVFAQMRVQNKQYLKTFKELGKLLGAQTEDPQALYQLVQQKVVQAQAKQQGIPPELLVELNQLKEQNAITQQERLMQQSLQGFQTVKDTYKLTDQEVEEFAAKLSAAGVNPFMQKVDLAEQYKLMYFDKIINQKVEQALQSERERSNKANNNAATTPNKNGGSTTNDDVKINSQNDFDEWLNSAK